MKRNLILLAFFVVSLLLVVNSTKRLMSFKTTAQKVDEAQVRLAKLREENERLQADLEYKRGQEFTEGEIRNKLGLAKEGEAVVVLPRDDEQLTTNDERQDTIPHYVKWWKLFFGG